MTKADIRNQIKKELSDPLIKKSLSEQSRNLCSQILSSRLYTSCTTLLAYMPLPDEADIKPVIEDALKKGKKVFLPRVFPDTNKMEFYSYKADTQTVTGSFGITEPSEEAINAGSSFSKFLERMSINEYSPAAHSSDFVEIKEPEQGTEHILILVPGRAFTKDGKRLGRGKGYYDIYFSSIPQIFDIKKSGVCFSQQLLPDLPTTPDDIMMDFVFYSDFDKPLRDTQSL